MSEHIAALSVPFPGAKRPLEEGAKLGLWTYTDLTKSNPNGVVEIPEADWYIFGAWHPCYDPIVSWLTGKGCKILVLWTSSAGEMDLEPVERDYLRTLLADVRISRLWFGDRSLAEVYSAKGFYAPYPLQAKATPVLPTASRDNIATLFCTGGLKKNILNQLLAMALVQRQRRLTLHTNIPGYDSEMEGLDHVRHSWLDEAEYRNLIGRSRVNLACSWAETFNYQVAEAALLGTPSVTSPTIPLPGQLVNCTNDPSSIERAILKALELDPVDVQINQIWFSDRNNAQFAETIATMLKCS